MQNQLFNNFNLSNIKICKIFLTIFVDYAKFNYQHGDLINLIVANLKAERIDN